MTEKDMERRGSNKRTKKPCGSNVWSVSTWLLADKSMTLFHRFPTGLSLALCALSSTIAVAGSKATRSTVVFLLAFAVFVSGMSEGWAMGVFDRLVLFSEVHGTVLKDGKPVAGAELIQKVVWSDNENEIPPQRTVTDNEGAFRFPAIERKAGLLRLIPAQPTIQQTIVIRYQGVEYMAWLHGKDSYNANTELDDRPINLVCELTRQADYEGKHYGICKAG